ncbi:hypothetical protein C7M84_010912 [Penaeus vannamei]|uniref:Uncharacterized protein n=1 Tax=Penaeus vannamei TaxID=6689 RepID=A0A423T311_PENVA|nr:hypothetical protein C7M84_010912 [Penaeus vannamei]
MNVVLSNFSKSSFSGSWNNCGGSLVSIVGYFGFSHGKTPPEKPDDSRPALPLLRPEATPGRNGDEGGGAFQIKGGPHSFRWLVVGGRFSLDSGCAAHRGGRRQRRRTRTTAAASSLPGASPFSLYRHRGRAATGRTEGGRGAAQAGQPGQAGCQGTTGRRQNYIRLQPPKEHHTQWGPGRNSRCKARLRRQASKQTNGSRQEASEPSPWQGGGRYSRWPSLLFNLPHPWAPQEEGRGIAGGFFLSRRKGVHTRDLTPRYRRNVAEGRRTAGAQPSRGEGRKRGAALGNHSERQERGGRLCEGQDHSRHWRGWHGDWLPRRPPVGIVARARDLCCARFGGEGNSRKGPTPELTKSTGRRPNPQKTPHTPGLVGAGRLSPHDRGAGPLGPGGQGRQPLRRPRQPGPPKPAPLSGTGAGEAGASSRRRGPRPRRRPGSALGPKERRGQESPSRPLGGEAPGAPHRPRKAPPAPTASSPPVRLQPPKVAPPIVVGAGPQPPRPRPGPSLGRPPGKNGPFGGNPGRAAPVPYTAPTAREGAGGRRGKAQPAPARGRRGRLTGRSSHRPAALGLRGRGDEGERERKPKPPNRGGRPCTAGAGGQAGPDGGRSSSGLEGVAPRRPQPRQSPVVVGAGPQPPRPRPGPALARPAGARPRRGCGRATPESHATALGPRGRQGPMG